MLDRIDRMILEELQLDAALSVAQLGERVGLSSTPCWKRIKRMEDEGLLTGRVALVDRKKVGLPVTVFVSLRISQHDEASLQRLAALIADMPEVQEFHRMSGDVDYLLKVVTTSIEGFDQFYKKLIAISEFRGVSSAFSMEQIKSSTALPLGLV